MRTLYGLLVFGVFLHTGCSTSQTATGTSRSTTDAQKKRICPDQWVINKQPKIVRNQAEGQAAIAQADEYFMYQGKRLEKEQIDTDWMRRNCRLEPTIVN